MTNGCRFLDTTKARRDKSTQIKVCGLTRLEDAVQVAKLGVDALGLIFYPPSSRNLTEDKAKTIRESLPPEIAAVAVVVNPHDELLETITNTIKPDFIQFHGDESERRCLEPGIPFIKAIRVRSAEQVRLAVESYPTASGLLLDAYVKDKVGGTGVTFSWDEVPQIEKPIVLAGGLHSGNVAKAIAEVKPMAVDVSTGVESQAGLKDTSRVQEFIAAVQATDYLIDTNQIVSTEVTI